MKRLAHETLHCLIIFTNNKSINHELMAVETL